MTQVQPVRREVLVDATPDVAFRVFTERIGAWWPLGEHGVHGEGGSVAFEGDELVEVGPGGDRALWGTVSTWSPGETLSLSWHPGKDPTQASQVTVTFAAASGQTLVTLVHDGWEVFEDPAAARDEYDHGWPGVLDHYVAVAKEGIDG